MGLERFFTGNVLLTIDQISRITGVRKSTLRYWERSFEEFLKPVRTESRRREYTLDDLDLVKTIKRLLEEEHLTAQGVRIRLGETHAATTRDHQRRRLKSG
jgi:DNA-binding transcriptional MerR regulator